MYDGSNVTSKATGQKDSSRERVMNSSALATFCTPTVID
jgi:hypothetical protein